MARIFFFFCRKRNLPVLRNLKQICLQYPVTQHFQIPIRPGNSEEKSHSVESTEIPIYLFYFYLLKKKKENQMASIWTHILIVLLKGNIFDVPSFSRVLMSKP